MLLLSAENEATRSSLYRFFHRSSIRLEGEMSAEDKKKMLKAKAKSAMAEKAKAEKETTSDQDASNKEAGGNTKSDGSSSSSSSSGDPPPNKNEVTDKSPPTQSSPTTASDGTAKEYSYPELTADAAKHKAGMNDPNLPEWQNPLHHNNPDNEKVFEEDFKSKKEFEQAVIPAPPVADANGKVPAPEHIQQLADEMVNLTMLEYNELINKVAEHYGFSESDLAPDDDPNAAGDDDDEDAPVVEAKTKFDVKLVSFEATAKIKIIKEIRAIVAGLGLKEAKALVESAPVTLQKDMSKESADEVKAKIEALGAVVEVE